MGLLEKIFGDMNSREIKKIEKIVDQIEAYDEEMQALTDDELHSEFAFELLQALRHSGLCESNLLSGFGNAVEIA